MITNLGHAVQRRETFFLVRVIDLVFRLEQKKIWKGNYFSLLKSK